MVNVEGRVWPKLVRHTVNPCQAKVPLTWETIEVDVARSLHVSNAGRRSQHYPAWKTLFDMQSDGGGQLNFHFCEPYCVAVSFLAFLLSHTFHDNLDINRTESQL